MRLLHGRVSIELHTLKPAKGRPLLLLHALGASAETWPETMITWPQGPIYALDFAGHGKSGRVRGGAYYPEYFLADADLALEQIGEPCVVVGAGIGAYVAMLLAGARADRIPAALLLEGAGLEGGGSLPDHHRDQQKRHAGGGEGIEGFEADIAAAASAYLTETDPLVAQCERDIRPLDYVTSFAEAAPPLLFSPRVGREVRVPDWWQTAVEVNPGIVAPEDLAESLNALASMGSESA
jgi:pimeloyl-ACP methyl ester carboxylesterase